MNRNNKSISNHRANRPTNHSRQCCHICVQYHPPATDQHAIYAEKNKQEREDKQATATPALASQKLNQDRGNLTSPY